MARPLTYEIFTETILPIFPSSFEGGSVNAYLRSEGDRVQRILTSRDSVPIDKYSIYGNLGETTRIHKYFRLAYKLGIRAIRTHMTRFAVDFDKFRTRRDARYYNISGRPFSSTSDSVQDMRRVAKVKTFLMRHLTREPTEKDVDLVVYTYFGSDAFADTFTDLHNGLQDSYYNARGRRRIHSGAQRRRQSRIQSYGNMYNNSTYRYHSYNNNSSNNNGLGSNSNNNGLGSNSNSNSNSNNRPTVVEYLQNKPAVKRNQNRNKNAKKIQWKENTVNNMPRDIISFENISNGEKVVKYSWKTGGETHTRYFQPNTFRAQSRMSMTGAYNKPGSFSLFENPETRANVKRANINFVILKKRVNKRKTNAATKIQKVVRGTQVRNKIRKNAQNALNKLAVVQKSVLKKKTEKQATAKRKRNAEDEAKRKRGRKD